MPKSTRRRPVLLGISIFSICLALALAAVSPVPDLQVYRLGAQALLDGVPLYDPIPPALADLGLPFTYPPFAALLFAPLAVLPLRVGSVLLTGLGLAALLGTLVLTSRRGHAAEVWSRRGKAAVPAALGATAFGVILLDPARTTVMAGQINLILLGLVAADCLSRRPRWPRGLLIGIAASVKLTPAVFIVYLLARRQWRAAATATGTFLAIGAAGFAFAPADSARYWLHTLADTDRIGPNAWPINQSLHGVLARFGLEGATLAVLWLAAAAAVVALAYLLASRLRDDTGALLVVAAAGLLASPVSWTHHWVWIAVAAPVLWRLARRSRRPVFTAGVVGLIVVFVVGMPYQLTMLSDPGTGWSPLTHLWGDSYAIAALVVLALVTVHVFRRPAVASTTVAGERAVRPPVSVVGQTRQRPEGRSVEHAAGAASVEQPGMKEAEVKEAVPR
jgi:alpha-1,2-mannosyltransferase